MRLINKKTGESYETTMPIVFNIKTNGGGEHTVSCESITELNDAWEDAPEESKKYWTVDCGLAVEYTWHGGIHDLAAEAVGLKFDTKEECERAIEKMKAWTRLKNKGFRFNNWDLDADDEDVNVLLSSDTYKGYKIYDFAETLDLLFGGEE